MKKPQILLIAFLISLAIFAFASMQAKAQATATVSVPTLSPGSTISYGSSATATVMVSGDSGTPTGTVQFQVSTDGGFTWNDLGSAVPLFDGSATSTSYTPTAPGSNYQFQVSTYSGDSNYDPVNTPTSPVTLTVNQATPTTGTTLSQSSGTLGLSVTDTAIVSAVGSGATPTGSVTFQVSTDGGSTFNQYGAVESLSSGSATSDAYPAQNVGTFYFRAVYGGDTNYASSQSGNSAEPLTITQTSASVGAASFSPSSPITLGGSVTVSAIVSGPGGVTAPTGNVQFQVSIDGGSYANTGSLAALSSGSASISYTPQTATTYNFKAVYEGDSNYVSGTTSVASSALTVTKGTPTVPAPTLSIPTSTTVGTSETLSVTVSGSGATPTGTATFQVNINGGGYNAIGSAVTLSGAGSASTTYTPPVTAGSYQFEVVYSGDSNYVTGTSSATSLTVNPGPASKLAFVGVPSSLGAGATSVAITVQLQDQYGNPVNAGSVITVTLSPSGVWYSNSPGTTPISSVTISSGSSSSSSFYFMSTAAGLVSLGASATGYTSASASLTMTAATAASFVVSDFPSPTIAGVAHSVMVTAKDVYDNTATGYSGTVEITSSDSHAGLPASAGLTNGVGFFTVTLETAGTQSITATDTVHSFLSGVQTGITVNVASGIYFRVIDFPNTTVAGVPHSITVIAYDEYDNLATDYSGTVAITSSDSQAVLPPSAALTNGIGSFTVTLKTTGTQSITATDTVTSSINGLQNDITVTAAGLDHILISPASPSIIAGNSQAFTVEAFDQYGNSLGDVTSSATFTCPGASVKGNSVTATAAGSHTVTATYNGKSNPTTLIVNAGALDHFVFNIVGTQAAGSAFNIMVTAVDAYGNTVTSYTGMPSLTVFVGSIIPDTMNAFVNGLGSTTVTLVTAGSNINITATGGTQTGTSNSFTVTAASTPAPTPTPTPTSSPSPTSTPNPASTPTPTATPTPTTTSSPTSTPSKTHSPALSPLELVVIVVTTAAEIIAIFTIIAIIRLRRKNSNPRS